jgi:hypothetical protein
MDSSHNEEYLDIKEHVNKLVEALAYAQTRARKAEKIILEYDKKIDEVIYLMLTLGCFAVD